MLSLDNFAERTDPTPPAGTAARYNPGTHESFLGDEAKIVVRDEDFLVKAASGWDPRTGSGSPEILKDYLLKRAGGQLRIVERLCNLYGGFC